VSWLNKCGTYFHGMGTAPKERVWMASLHMEGAAAEWYYALECDVGLLSWTRFSEFVNMQFGPLLRTNDMADMKELWYTGTLEAFFETPRVERTNGLGWVLIISLWVGVGWVIQFI
jgi:hypothetical protein